MRRAPWDSTTVKHGGQSLMVRDVLGELWLRIWFTLKESWKKIFDSAKHAISYDSRILGENYLLRRQRYKSLM